DISQRLKKRLKKLFPHWDELLYEEAAIFCLQQTNVLDGIKVLKALNPNDYEIHSFLASILAVKSLNIKEITNDTVLKSFISLDSYNHWFENEPNRPDFLELEIARPGIEGEKLVIKA
ncbi:hypothetical protein JQK62_24445, partial [Leptospira santarosai]|nr:hypothetical protein [Leptospira santarosai]